MKLYDRVMWSSFTSWVQWIYPVSNTNEIPENTDEKLMSDWQYLLSTSEERAQREDEKRSQEVQSELRKIALISNSLTYRSRIHEFVRQSYSQLPEETRNLFEKSRLDASKRDKICRDLIRSVATFWLTVLHQRFPILSSDFSFRWYEQAYKKNICGSLVAMAFHASHPAQQKGLTCVYIQDILWAIYLSLSREISAELNRSLLPEENDLLLDLVLSLEPSLISLWSVTAESVGSIAEREGKLPQQWEVDTRREQKRIAEIKRQGVTARYNDGPVEDPIRKTIQERKAQQQSATKCTYDKVVNTGAIASRRDLLAQSLILSRPKK